MSKKDDRYFRVDNLPKDWQDDGNPRKISKKNYEKLKQSIDKNRDFFEARPVLMNKREDGTLRIIGGHQRLKAAIELGWDKFPVYIFNGLDEEKEKYYTTLDNDNAGTWDFGKLADYDIDLSEFNVSLPETVDYNEILARDVLQAIIYKPSEKRAAIGEFLDNEEYDKIKAEVEKLEIPKELREFVYIRLNCFRRFNFDKIADYYARADEPTKLLFRQLALVFDVSGTSFERDLLDFYSQGLETPEIYE